MKKVIAWLLVLALTAAISIGATLAYLTDTDEDVNVMTVGKVKIEQLEYERVDVETEDENATVQEFQNNKPLYPAVTENGFDYTPGDSFVDWTQIGKDGYTSDIWDPSKINNEIDKMVFVKNKGDYDAYVRSVFAFEAVPGWSFDDFKSKVHLNLNTNEEVVAWEWIETPVAIGEGTYFLAVATYKDALKPGAISEISLSQIALDKTATNEDMEALGETYNVLVKSQAIQADGFADASTGLNEGFGKIAASSVPFTNDQPPKGIDVRSALRYYQGDVNQPIHTEVTNVVFGLSKDYPAIVNNSVGTLVTEEQDRAVYAYYAEEDGKYSIYFLSNGQIYLPTDCSRLFYKMSALASVDTSNLNTSRVENMHELFRYCHSLKSVDVSKWDVSNVKDMFSVFDECKLLTTVDVSQWKLTSAETTSFMFYGCEGMQTIPVGNWDTSNVTNMRGMFENCKAMPMIDVDDWDTSNVTDMGFMFKGCISLEELNIGNWDTGNVQAFNSMFSGIGHNTGEMKFTELPIENWDTSSATNIGYMFYGCGNLTKLDLHKWDVSKVTTMRHTFADCNSITEYNFTGWNTESLQNMDGIFNSNKALVTIDVSDFDTSNVTDFRQVFDGCTSLETIVGLTNWDTSKGVYFGEFLLGSNMVSIDLSSFDMSSAKYVLNMFHVNPRLTTIYVGDNWNLNPDNLSSANGMFGSSGALRGGNGSSVSSLGSNSAIFARVDTPETPGLLTHIDDKPVTE